MEIVRLKGFSLESDVFVDMIDAMEKDRPAMGQIANKAARIVMQGGAKDAYVAIKPLVRNWILKSRMVDKMLKNGSPKLQEAILLGGAKFYDVATNIVAQGFVKDLIESPYSYRKFIENAVFDNMDSLMVERGKTKFKNMMQNRGASMNNKTAAAEIQAVAKLMAGEVPESFKKQWKDKDKDNDGKINEPKPEFLKKASEIVMIAKSLVS